MRWMLYATLSAALFGLLVSDADGFGRRGRGGCANGSCGGTASSFSAAGCSSGACSTLSGNVMTNGSCINGICTPEQWMAANPPQPAYNTLTVTCPADAELYVEGKATTQRGASRTFSWEGKGGTFTLKCRWKDGPNVRVIEAVAFVRADAEPSEGFAHVPRFGRIEGLLERAREVLGNGLLPVLGANRSNAFRRRHAHPSGGRRTSERLLPTMAACSRMARSQSVGPAGLPEAFER